MNNVKTILLIGRTGNGKSTLANVLLGEREKNGNFKEVFGESAGSVSKTKKIQIEKFVDKEIGVEYQLIDTVGIGDTEMTLDKVLRKLALMGYSVRDGLSQILFVTDGQLAKEAKSTYDLLEQVVFDKKVAKYTTVIRTRFASFRNNEDCEKEKKKMIENSEGSRSLIERCKEVVFVDNPPIDIDDEDLARLYIQRREGSRERLLEYLRSICQEEDTYRPVNLVILSSEIGECMDEKDELKRGELEKNDDKKLDEEKKKNRSEKASQNIIKFIKEEIENKIINEKITKAMLEHIGNIDWGLKKNIEEHLKKLEEEKESGKEKKPSKWGVVGNFTGRTGKAMTGAASMPWNKNDDNLEVVKRELEKRKEKTKTELTDIINYVKNRLDEEDWEIETVMNKIGDLKKEKLDNLLAKKFKIIQIESQLDKLRQEKQELEGSKQNKKTSKFQSSSKFELKEYQRLTKKDKVDQGELNNEPKKGWMRISFCENYVGKENKQYNILPFYRDGSFAYLWDFPFGTFVWFKKSDLLKVSENVIFDNKPLSSADQKALESRWEEQQRKSASIVSSN